MVEEGGEGFSRGRSPSSPLPPSPSRHPLSSPAGAPTRNPGDLPGLSDCHCCGLHFPSKSLSHNLHILDSQWRVVLLCSPCLSPILSAEACSYCFSKIAPDEEESLLDCGLCSHRVHLRCAHQCYLTLSELKTDSFTCIDCCPYVRSCYKKPSCAVRPVSLEQLVKDASGAVERKKAVAARVKEKAVQKATAARDASKGARSVLDAVAKEPAPKAESDEELAIQLHLAMNGSRRISRSRSANLGCPTGSKRPRRGDNCAGNAEASNYNIYENVGISTEDKGLLETTKENWSNLIILIQPDTSNEDQKRRIDGCDGSDLVAVPMNAEKERCNQISPVEMEIKQNDDPTSRINGYIKSNSVEIPLKQEQEICDQSSSLELPNGNRDQMRARNGCSKSNFLEVPIQEEQGSCDESSSAKPDSDEEKVQMKGIDGHDESNIVEEPVGEEQEMCDQSSSNESESNGRKDYMEAIYEHTENKLVGVDVKRRDIFNRSILAKLNSEKEKDQAKGNHGCSGNNFVKVAMKEEEGVCKIIRRCMKKYNKNQLGLKEMMDKKGSQIVHCQNMSYSEASETLPNAAHQSPTVPVPTSLYARLSDGQ